MSHEPVTLAQELHDGIAQDLVGLGYCVDSILFEQANTTIRSQLRDLRFSINQMLEKVRTEIHQLRTSPSVQIAGIKPSTEYELNRVISEILSNVLTHACAKNLTITITDDGVGGAVSRQGSFGLIGIHERVNKLNGDIHIHSLDSGTRIDINIPLGG